ncbi:hypothetical protein AAHA92_01090 [Salvia divinorum]|uniref:Uncharacterized protein n=1 Tax=Salvia divinorum TaxID=28513 RepID=A0ABD1ILQ2_SALDI
MPSRRARTPRHDRGILQNEAPVMLPNEAEENDHGVEAHPPPQRRRVEETFLKQNSPVFDGLGDPLMHYFLAL